MKDIRVLFVDDEIDALSSYERYLIAEPYKKHFISRPRKALDYMSSNRVDIVVSDLKMPGMDGLTFLRKVKKRWPDTIRMVLSAFTEAAQLIPCINSGEIFRYIPKPIDPGEFRIMLTEAVLEALRKADKEELIRRLTKSYASLKQMNQELERLSVTDSLTTLYTPRYLFMDLRERDQTADPEVPLSLVFLDIRKFRAVVSQLGHIGASQVLASLGRALSATLPPPCYGATLGGDLFILVLPGMDRPQAQAFVKDLTPGLGMTRPPRQPAPELSLEFTTGLAVWPEDASLPSGLMKAADRSLSSAKTVR